MKNKEPVSQIMTRHVHYVRTDEGLVQAMDIIRQHHIRHLPVIKDDQIVGIISSTDLDRLTFSNLFENQEGSDEVILSMLSIPQVMSSKPVVVSPDTSIREVAEIFAAKHFHSLPVVEEGKLVGIVTTTDIIRYLIDQYQE